MLLTALVAFLTIAAPAVAQNREEQLYESATEALDDGEWKQAAERFTQVARLNGERAPAALHWLAYAQHKMGQRSEALGTLVDLQQRFPRSKWAADGKALELEIRQSAGQSVAPDRVDDEDLKLMAVNGLMHADPERALPILEKIINGNQSDKVKAKALFILAQANTPRALEMMGRIARDGSRPELQARALRNLGIVGGEASRKVLADVYASTTDRNVKKSILKSWMISGDRGRLLAAAKGESDPELRATAVQQLGLTGARNELAELYVTEQSIEVRKKIIQAMFLGGNADKLAELARNEKVVELRLVAIKNLGLMGGGKTGLFLTSMYESDPNPEVRKAVINGLFLQSNATALIALARKEQNRELKRQIVSKLSLINSKATTDYLLEILNE
ncbi:MAG TPA: HEAT repeat domain-containing protein [Thermoanaerobaculia bacterium]|nr:HEAT repeat domain-containing protein [Thermoanaerobaculia bacterium]